MVASIYLYVVTGGYIDEGLTDGGGRYDPFCAVRYVAKMESTFTALCPHPECSSAHVFT